MSRHARLDRAVRAATAAWALAGACAAHAQDDRAPQAAAVLPPVTVTAFRIPVLLDGLTSTVDVVTRDAIEARQPLTALDALRTVPGLHVERQGGPGGVAQVYIRGAEPNHTLVLVDGVRVNDLNDARGGGYDLSAIAAHEIERIEVLRGAHSAAFGADAMGGVVHVVTRRTRPDPVATVRVGAGGQGYREAGATLAGRAAALTVGRLEDGTLALGSRRAGNSLSGHLAFAPAAGWHHRLSLRSLARDSDAFPEASGGMRLAELRALEHRRLHEHALQLDTDIEPGERLRWNVRLARVRRDEDVSSPGVAPGPGGALPASDTDSRLTRDIAAVTARLDRLPLHGAVTLGAEILRESGRFVALAPALGPDPAGYALARRTRSLFGDWRGEPAKGLLLALSLRRDAVSALEAITSTGAGLRWRVPGTAVSLRAHAAEGFKPPSFFALGHPLIGNPGLAPETSRSLELGASLDAGTLHLGATAFESRHANLIDFDAETFRLVNRRRVRVRGIELQASHAASAGTQAHASFTWVRHHAEAGTVLRNRPAHRASVGAQARLGAWQLQADWLHVGPTHDFAVPTGDVRLDARERVDVSLRRTLGAHLTLEFALDNLLDQRRDTHIGFVEPGRRARLALTARL